MSSLTFSGRTFHTVISCIHGSAQAGWVLTFFCHQRVLITLSALKLLESNPSDFRTNLPNSSSRQDCTTSLYDLRHLRCVSHANVVISTGFLEGCTCLPVICAQLVVVDGGINQWSRIGPLQWKCSFTCLFLLPLAGFAELIP